MDCEQRLLQKKKAIEEELERFLPSPQTPLHQAMRHAVFSGGKRFRALLTLCTGEGLGADQRMLLPFSCAVELIHNYSLVHDDLPSMDNDDYRRGQPSCHKAYGEDTAILVGDALLTLSFQVLAQAPLEDKLASKRERIIQEMSYHAGAEGMIGGQYLDLSVSSGDISEEVLHELMVKKTGSLITASVKTGALLGEASPSQWEALVEYSKNLGLAFQTRDDILDYTKDKQENGLSPPNSVSFFGLHPSRERFKKFIQAGMKELDKVNMDQRELRFLTQKLMDIKV